MSGCSPSYQTRSGRSGTNPWAERDGVTVDFDKVVAELGLDLD